MIMQDSLFIEFSIGNNTKQIFIKNTKLYSLYKNRRKELSLEDIEILLHKLILSNKKDDYKKLLIWVRKYKIRKMLLKSLKNL